MAIISVSCAVLLLCVGGLYPAAAQLLYVTPDGGDTSRATAAAIRLSLDAALADSPNRSTVAAVQYASAPFPHVLFAVAPDAARRSLSGQSVRLLDGSGFVAVADLATEPPATLTTTGVGVSSRRSVVALAVVLGVVVVLLVVIGVVAVCRGRGGGSASAGHGTASAGSETGSRPVTPVAQMVFRRRQQREWHRLPSDCFATLDDACAAFHVPPRTVREIKSAGFRTLESLQRETGQECLQQLDCDEGVLRAVAQLAEYVALMPPPAHASTPADVAPLEVL